MAAIQGMQAGAVVAHADVAAQPAHLVHGLTHQAEVLWVAVPPKPRWWRRRAEVQQGLAGGADDGDDVGALAGGGGGPHHVLIDVAGSHDQVTQGPCFSPLGGNEVLAALAAGADLARLSSTMGARAAWMSASLWTGSSAWLVGGHVLGDGLGTLPVPPWRCRSRRHPGAARPCPSGGPPRRWAGGRRRRPPSMPSRRQMVRSTATVVQPSIKRWVSSATRGRRARACSTS